MGLCGHDYRDLNAVIKEDSGGLGDKRAIFKRFLRAKYYTTLGMASAFFHLPLNERDCFKAAFLNTRVSL